MLHLRRFQCQPHSTCTKLFRRACARHIHSKDVSKFLNGSLDSEHFDEIVKGLTPRARYEVERALIKREQNERTGQSSEDIIKEEMKRADLNCDGLISQSEFREWFRSRALYIALKSKSTSVEAAPLEAVVNEQPSIDQLVKLFIRTGTPFFAFGCIDNLIMIMAGGVIEDTLGVALGLSTLTAAGLGNMLADGLGIGISRYIEVGADKIGLPNPNLTDQQSKSRSARVTAMASGTLCICLGCLVGMSPLFLR